jgi:hypothetical protein
MKQFKSKKWFLALVIIAAAGIILYPHLGNNDESEPGPTGLSPTAMVDQALGKGRNVVVAFSYDAECCPGTEEFFKAYKESVFNVLNQFQEDAQLVWLNVGTPQKQDQEEMTALAGQYGVEYLPSLLILNSVGETIDIIVGPLNEQQLREALSGEGR